MQFKIWPALALAVWATDASAQGFDEASVTLSTTDVDVEGIGSFRLLTCEGDISFTFGGGFGAQVGYNMVRDTGMDPALGFSVDYSGLELHAFYDVNADLRIGIMAATRSGWPIRRPIKSRSSGRLTSRSMILAPSARMKKTPSTSDCA